MMLKMIFDEIFKTFAMCILIVCFGFTILAGMDYVFNEAPVIERVNLESYTDSFISLTHYIGSNHTVIRMIEDDCFEIASAHDDSRYFLCNPLGEEIMSEKEKEALNNHFKKKVDLCRELNEDGSLSVVVFDCATLEVVELE